MAARTVPAALRDSMRDAGHVTEPGARARGKSRPRMPRLDLKPRLDGHVIAYLDSLTLAQLICLCYGHIWPVLIPGRGRPRGWRASVAPNRDRVARITEECVRNDAGYGCGTVRTSYTGERGIFLDHGTNRQYAYDEKTWAVRPDGSRLTRVDVYNYILWRCAGELFAEPEQGDGAIG
jgi:hypothetical protein